MTSQMQQLNNYKIQQNRLRNNSSGVHINTQIVNKHATLEPSQNIENQKQN
jgi:hypothetical protein